MNATTAEQELPARTRAALQHLRRTDQGYAIERYLATSGKVRVRLKRRNVPVRDEDFEEIVLDRATGRVVGLRAPLARGDAGRGVVLVDREGKPVRDGPPVSVRMEDAASASAARGGAGTAPRGGGGASTGAPLSDEENARLLRYGGLAVGALLALKLLCAAATSLSFVLLLPLLYFYLLSTRPEPATFDAKREIKRVLRGAHLPEERQPRGFFEQGLNRLAASVTTELATSLGYETDMTDLGGAATLMSVKVPVAGAEYYWLGIAGKWRYAGQRELGGKRD